MKLSEALRAGAVGHKQCSGVWVGAGNKCCALGAIGYGVGLEKMDIGPQAIRNVFPELIRTPVYRIHEKLEEDSLERQIICLNDELGLTFEEIALVLEREGF